MPLSTLPVGERHVGVRADPDEPELPLAADGVQRYVWHGAYGDTLIEIRGDVIYVNGDRVEAVGDAG